MYFNQKVIWITGASSGIGEHLAYALAKAGARLILSSRKLPELERVKANCPPGSEVVIEPLDVGDFVAIPEVAKKVLARFGQVDILINNAGISQRELALDTKFEVDQQIMNVNYLGTVALTKLIAPVMVARKSGQIVVMSSVMGKFGAPYRSAYAASKHALHGFFDSLRAELHPYNVKITILCPGYVRTNVTINALRGDGAPNQVMADSTASGYPPEVFANKALKAIANQREEVVIGQKEALGVYIKRFAPSVYSRIARNLKLK